MNAHTPGPWRAAKSRGAVVADAPIPEVGGSDAVGHYGGHMVAESIAQRNVPIITAAPDLLEALRLAVRTIRTWHGMGMGASEAQAWELYQSSPEMRQINEAIAKGEGRS